MPEYSCEICGKIFNRKSGFDNHKKRKNPCKKPSELVNIIKQAVQNELANLNIVVSSLPPPLPPLLSPPPQSTPKPTLQILKPILKWVGGKTQILDDILALFPSQIKNYHEPFLGGASVLLGLLSKVKAGQIKLSGKIYASDLNRNLIALYKNIQTSPQDVVSHLKKLTNEFSGINGTEINRQASTLEEAMTSQESYYFWIRKRFNALSDEEHLSPLASAMVIFMNKTCFRGVYREGPKGFNVPFGNYKNPGILDEKHIMEVSELIKPVIFSTNPFSESLKLPTSGDFVYLDPPYAPENTTSFVSYTADGFTEDKHKALFKLCNNLTTINVKVLMSNSDVNLVKNAFPPPQYTIKTIECRRAINSKNPQAKTNEVLISNYQG